MFDNLRKWLDFDDLLFKTRNREYGAYQLRKNYNSVVIKGIIISSFIICCSVLLPFVIRPREEKVLVGHGSFAQLQLEDLKPPEEQIYVPPPPPPKQSVHVEEMVKYVPPKVVDSVPPMEKQQLSTDEYINQTNYEITDAAGEGNGDSIYQGPGGMESDAPFFLVEVMPTFKGGGLEKFREWVQKRTSYPQAAYEHKIRGTVYLTFIVEKDGSVSNVTVVKSVDPLLDNEAVKAISESPKWTPGLQRGEPVRVRYSIPMNFMF